MNYLNATGLIIDMIGVLILFKYGLPSEMNLPPKIELEQGLTIKEKKQNKTIKRRSKIGLSCLIIGFLFQAIASIAPTVK